MIRKQINLIQQKTTILKSKQNMKTCPIRKYSYQDDISFNINKLQQSSFSKKRKSMTIYSTLNYTNELKPNINKDHKQKLKLQLNSKNHTTNHHIDSTFPIQSHQYKKDENYQKNKSKFNMNFCGPSLCQKNTQNNNLLCFENNQTSIQDDKMSRVIYMSKKPRQLSANNKKPQSVFHQPNQYFNLGLNGYKLNELSYQNTPKVSRFISANINDKVNDNSVIYFTNNNKSSLKVNNNKSDLKLLKKNENLLKTNETQKNIDYDLINKNQSQKQMIQKPKGLQKNNSLSIVNYSTIGNSHGQILSTQNQFDLRYIDVNQNIQKINKLKQIYLFKQSNQLNNKNSQSDNLNSQRTSISYQYDQNYKSSPKNHIPQLINHLPQLINHNSLYFSPNYQTPKLQKNKTSFNLSLQNINKQQLFCSNHTINKQQESLPQQPNSQRSIIDMLKDQDCKSDISLTKSYNQKIRHQNIDCNLNPQKQSIYSPSIKMYKPFISKINK